MLPYIRTCVRKYQWKLNATTVPSFCLLFIFIGI
nr:MAG TPA: hypothetical protein [Caudoviricetes sp.]